MVWLGAEPLRSTSQGAPAATSIAAPRTGGRKHWSPSIIINRVESCDDCRLTGVRRSAQATARGRVEPWIAISESSIYKNGGGRRLTRSRGERQQHARRRGRARYPLRAWRGLNEKKGAWPWIAIGAGRGEALARWREDRGEDETGVGRRARNANERARGRSSGTATRSCLPAAFTGCRRKAGRGCRARACPRATRRRGRGRAAPRAPRAASGGRRGRCAAACGGCAARRARRAAGCAC